MTKATITRASLEAIVAQARARISRTNAAGSSLATMRSKQVRPIANIQNLKHAENPAAFPRDARTAFLMDPKQHLTVLNETRSAQTQIADRLSFASGS